MIEFTCTKCGAVMRVSDELAGKKGKCLNCGSKCVVPMPQTPDWQLGSSAFVEAEMDFDPAKVAQSGPAAPEAGQSKAAQSRSVELPPAKPDAAGPEMAEAGIIGSHGDADLGIQLTPPVPESAASKPPQGEAFVHEPEPAEAPADLEALTAATQVRSAGRAASRARPGSGPRHVPGSRPDSGFQVSRSQPLLEIVKAIVLVGLGVVIGFYFGNRHLFTSNRPADDAATTGEPSTATPQAGYSSGYPQVASPVAKPSPSQPPPDAKPAATGLTPDNVFEDPPSANKPKKNKPKVNPGSDSGWQFDVPGR